jgi:hypothetical protein
MNITSSEGTEFTFSHEMCKLSGLLNEIVEPEGESISIQLNTIILTQIHRYLTQFVKTPVPFVKKPIDGKMINNTDKWCVDFIDPLSVKELIDLTNSANYMDIASLLDLCMCKIASLIKNGSHEEVMEQFKNFTK